jgi:hypothetical protein
VEQCFSLTANQPQPTYKQKNSLPNRPISILLTVVAAHLAKTSTSTAALHQLLLFKVVDLQNTLEQNMCTREIAKFKHVMTPAAIKHIQSKNEARTSEETADRTINNNLAAERQRAALQPAAPSTHAEDSQQGNTKPGDATRTAEREVD